MAAEEGGLGGASGCSQQNKPGGVAEPAEVENLRNTGLHKRCIKLASQPVDEWEETSNGPPSELHRRSTFPGSTTERTSNNDVI